MHESIINEIIENQACNVVNAYVKFWTPHKNASEYPVKQLDCMYYYLIYCHKIDIFNCDESLFRILCLI